MRLENQENMLQLRASIVNQTHHQKTKFYQEKCNYIHRCPFRHCLHNITEDGRENVSPYGIKISVNNFRTSHSDSKLSKDNLKNEKFVRRSKSNDDLIEEHNYIARNIEDRIVTTRTRQRAISYMFNRLRGPHNSRKSDQRLLHSIINSEKLVYETTKTQGNYTEILASKLCYILQEMKRRKHLNEEKENIS